jgi:hypothetical protein
VTAREPLDAAPMSHRSSTTTRTATATSHVVATTHPAVTTTVTGAG